MFLFILFLIIVFCIYILVRQKNQAKGKNKGTIIGYKSTNPTKSKIDMETIIDISHYENYLCQAIEKKPEVVIDFLEKSDKELRDFEIKAKIEDIANDIRTVVLCTVDLTKEPYPYQIKKDIPFIKKAHKNVISAYNTDLYGSAIKLASQIIFDDKEYKCFFAEYSANPFSYSLDIIKNAIPERYQDGLDEKLLFYNDNLI